MEKISFVVITKDGLDARPAGIIKTEARKYQSTILAEQNGRRVDCKRLLSLWSLDAKYNSTVTIEIEGDDEKEALEGIKKAIDSIADDQNDEL